jgi:hypothetical protein
VALLGPCKSLLAGTMQKKAHAKLAKAAKQKPRTHFSAELVHIFGELFLKSVFLVPFASFADSA